MPVYNINGDELNTVYDVDGTEMLTVYDVDGNEISLRQPYPIENVASYFREPTLAMESTISGLSYEWDNTVFITDPHGTRNQLHSQAIALYLLANTPNISRIVLNGDLVISDWVESQYNTYMSPFFNSDYMSDIYATVGNHDYGHEQTISNDFLVGKTNIVGSVEGCYYYTDIADKKLRLMFLNTSDAGVLTVSNNQLAWIAQNVILPDASWDLAVIGHINVDTLNGMCTDNLTNRTDVISAISGCNGTIVGYFCGHQHIDDTRNAGNFQQTTLMCDRFDLTNYYPGYSFTNRVAGTTTEQAVSVISINTTTKQVVVRRIGAGWPEIVSGLNYTYGS